ncbi:MAG TPA: acyl-CoA dehydrogenase family protein [Acidimicrobiia bacterium]|nr:acyl-CoA dehydrogenase family protein [Acidimicrobiia bacterium]
MEIALIDDQEFFRDTTRKFLGSECPIPKVRSLRSNPDGFERDYWRQGAELGWTSLLVPEDLGGGSVSGNGVADLALVADAFGAHVAPGPLLPCSVVATALSRSGSAEQQGELLPAIVAGDVVATWAFTEAPPHDRLGDIALRAEADGSDYVLTGVKSPVEAGAQADQLLVTATTDAGAAQFLLPPETPGVTVTPLRSVDLVRRYARIQFDGARVPATALVGEPGGAAADVEHQLQVAGVVQSAEMVGAAQVAFDLTLDWAFSRYSFGRPLASYQEIKHRFADMKMWLEASHALADVAARHDERDDASARAASTAKAYAGDYLAELVQDCVQLHGGIGVTYEHDLHLYLRRITVDRLTYGTPTEHCRRLGALRAHAA